MRFDNVQLRYTRRGPLILAGVDATFEPGEITVILGRNGAGKSTLLQIIAGVLPVTRGTVRDRPEIVGWVPERFPADQPFTVRTYLRTMAAIRGLASPDPDIDDWADRMGFAAYLDERLSNLSKGTAQKVGLVQALLVMPQLLVLDEPWEGLDAQTHDEISHIISDVVDNGGCVVVSDHRGEAAKLPGTTPWLLESGVLKPATTTIRAESAVPNSAPLWASPTMLTPTVTPDPSAGPTRRWVVEVSVAASDSDSAAGRLRAEGYEIHGVREEATR
jgi:ABC-type multidrug transport system ATPase subunit